MKLKKYSLNACPGSGIVWGMREAVNKTKTDVEMERRREGRGRQKPREAKRRERRGCRLQANMQSRLHPSGADVLTNGPGFLGPPQAWVKTQMIWAVITRPIASQWFLAKPPVQVSWEPSGSSNPSPLSNHVSPALPPLSLPLGLLPLLGQNQEIFAMTYCCLLYFLTSPSLFY